MRHPVTLAQTEIRAKGYELEVKRFCVPGYVLKTKCPECDADFERDYGEDYLSYPTIGAPFTETLYCYAQFEDGESCDHEWDVELCLSLTMTVSNGAP